MRVALIQVAYGDAEPVEDRIDRVAGLVRAQVGADLVVLPELWAPGGFAYRAWEDRAESLDGPTASAMSAAAQDAGVLLHAGSIVERLASPGPSGQWLSNTSLVFGPDGARVALYRKIHRFGFAAGEPALMAAGEDPLVVVDVAGGRLGLTTCYDLRFPELYRAQLDAGATVFVIPAAWPMVRVGHWTLLGRARAVENQCWVLACNTAGTHAAHEMGGHSQIVDPTGVVVAEAGVDEEVLVADVDLDRVRSWRTDFPVDADRRINPPPRTRPQDEGRLVARRAALARALGSLTREELADDETVAAISTAPGFTPGSGHVEATDALAASRVRRRADLARLLPLAPPAVRGEPGALADWLTGIREDLVHPMTGESLTLLDWVNRGGRLDAALAVLR
ncbi:MAG: carbon-nitrogen family hydrolase [Nostocoides sp.]